MNDGRLIIDKSGDRVTSVQIDRELIDFARLNRKVQQRVDRMAQQQREQEAEARAAQRQAVRSARKARAAKKRLAGKIGSLSALGGLMGCAWYMGWANPWFAGSVIVTCLTAAAWSLGAMCERKGRRAA